jgi:hypothetical protein
LNRNESVNTNGKGRGRTQPRIPKGNRVIDYEGDDKKGQGHQEDTILIRKMGES